MKTITKYIDLYEYSELDDNAKEQAKQDYLDSCRLAEDYSDMCEDDLAYLFPASDLEVQYSLGYCQGDGLNIYGTICLDDLLEHIQDNFSDKELRFLKWCFRSFSTMYKLPYNNQYSYCICDRHDYTEDIIDNLEWYGYRGIKYDVLDKFNSLSQDYMSELCSGYEKGGYEYFYEVEDDEMEDISYLNNWLYTADGKFYAA